VVQEDNTRIFHCSTRKDVGGGGGRGARKERKGGEMSEEECVESDILG